MINQKRVILLLLNFSIIINCASPVITKKTIPELKAMFIDNPASLTDLELLRLNEALMRLDQSFTDQSVHLVQKRPALCSIL